MFIFDIAMYKLFINKIHCVLIRFQVYSIGVIKVYLLVLVLRSDFHILIVWELVGFLSSFKKLGATSRVVGSEK